MNLANQAPGRAAVGADDDLSFDIEQVASRDFAAMARIHQRFGGKLSAICLRITGSSESADDALQEVYVKLWNRAASYDRRLSRPIIWLSTLARNSAIYLARAQRRNRTGRLLGHYDEANDSSHVDDYLIEQERQLNAIEMLETPGPEMLGDQQHEHIRDTYLKGLTYADLSRQHGIPVGMIKSRIHLGLLAMKKARDVD